MSITKVLHPFASYRLLRHSNIGEEVCSSRCVCWLRLRWPLPRPVRSRLQGQKPSRANVVNICTGTMENAQTRGTRSRQKAGPMRCWPSTGSLELIPEELRRFASRARQLRQAEQLPQRYRPPTFTSWRAARQMHALLFTCRTWSVLLGQAIPQ